MPIAAMALMFVSGAAAFACFMLWTRLFGFALGGSPAASLPVLAASIAGLAVGGLVSGRLSGSARGPFRLYGFLQIAFGISCALLPAAAPLAGRLYAAALAGMGEGASLQLARMFAAFLFVGVPGAIAGSFLPVLGRHEVRSHAAFVSAVGPLHAAGLLGGTP